MRKVRSRLTDGSTTILMMCGVSLFVGLCAFVLLTHHIVPQYGYSVRPAASNFAMQQYNRDNTLIVSVAAGETPRIYVGSRKIDGGLSAFAAMLDQWKKNNEAKGCVGGVVLVADSAVAFGTVQQMTEKVLERGMSCSYAAAPACN